jgi:hypothetical protein
MLEALGISFYWLAVITLWVHHHHVVLDQKSLKIYIESGTMKKGDISLTFRSIVDIFVLFFNGMCFMITHVSETAINYSGYIVFFYSLVQYFSIYTLIKVALLYRQFYYRLLILTVYNANLHMVFLMLKFLISGIRFRLLGPEISKFNLLLR